MAKIILILLLALGAYVAYRRFVAPPSIGKRDDPRIIDAEWTEVDRGADKDDHPPRG